MTKHTVRRGLSVLAAACLAVGAAGVATVPAAHAAPSDTSMVPVDLTRVVDTREGLGVSKALENNKSYDIQIASTEAVDPKAVVPKGADAVVLNMTAVDAAAPGYFVAWEAGKSRPATSNINFMAGDTVANGATVPLSADGKISVYSRGGAGLLLDVAGYYAEGKYTAVTPSRLFDTRRTPAETASARTITRINVGAAADELVTLNVTVDNPAADGYITAWPTDESPTEDPTFIGMPLTSNVNYTAGQTIANTVTVKAGTDGYVSFYTMSETALIVDKVHETAPTGFATMLEPAQRVIDTRENIGTDARTGYRTMNLLDLVENTPTGKEWDDVGAAIVNVTVAGADADGFVAIGPDLEGTGATTSVLNFKAGQTISNRVIIPASYVGNLQAYSNVPTDLILDVMGYTTASDVTPEAATLDLSDAKSTTTITTTSTLPGLSADTAIAVPVADNALYDLDGGASDPTQLDGNMAYVVNGAGESVAVTYVDHLATGGAASENKLVPLTGLAAGDYTLRIPLTTVPASSATEVLTGNYEIEFSVTTIAPEGADLEVVATGQRFQAADITGTGDVNVAVNGGAAATVTISSADATSAVAAISLVLDGPPALMAAPSSGDPTQLVLRVQGDTAAPTLTLDDSVSSTNLTLAATGDSFKEHPPVDDNGTLLTTELPVVGTTGQAANTVVAGPTAPVMLDGGQALEVTLPAGFGADTEYQFTSGEDLVGGAVAAAPDADQKITILPPGRSALDAADLPLTGELTVTISSVAGTSEVEFTIKVQ